NGGNGTTAIVAGNTVTFTPNAGFIGTDSFRYTIADGRGGVSTGVVTVRVMPPPPLTIPSLAADRAAPGVVNTPITFTANLTGGVAPYETKWWVFDGTANSLLKDWASGASMTWTPTTANPSYRIVVWARNAGSSVNTGAVSRVVVFPITAQQPLPPTIPSLTADHGAPGVVNTPITFTASLTGGVAPYETKWWVFDGTANSLLKDWASGASMTWTPTVANPNYRIVVWARSAGSSVNTGAVSRVVVFPINPLPEAVVPAALTSPVPGSVLPGPSASFTWSQAVGAAEYWLSVGTTQGGVDLYNRSQGLGRSATVSPLPGGSVKIFVRLWTRSGTIWKLNDYSFTSAP
ncbi:MAG TPA: Ig-like domain-containing protein, partial [Candidatus Methylomirabilis sp.]|nr:Ig-like domain-containing protein [Candidatus Methylomirabilis sp.]